VSSLQAAGAEVVLAACDVTDREQIARVLAGIDPSHPLTGVFHLAGVVDDGPLAALTEERLLQVLRPKVRGALLLHELTKDRDLAAFVLFSSAEAVLGAAGRASYAAANVFLDALAAERRKRGLAGQSLGWGRWTPQGGDSAAQVGEVELQMLAPLSYSEALSLFDAALPRAESSLVPVRLQLDRLRRAHAASASASIPPLLRALVRPSLRRAEAGHADAAALNDRLSKLSESARLGALVKLVQEVVAAVARLAGPDAVPADQSLRDLGLDSLMALEVRDRLARRTGTTLSPTLAFRRPTPEAIAQALLSQASSRSAEAPELALGQDQVAGLATRESGGPGGVPPAEADLGSPTWTGWAPFSRYGAELETGHVRWENGFELEVFRLGQGEPLLLLTPAASDAWIWWPVALLLADSYAVHLINYPGYGGAAIFPSATTPRLLARATAELREVLGYTKPWSVCGWSFGGLVGLALLSLHPSSVGRCVFAAMSASQDVDPVSMVRKIRADLDPRLAASGDPLLRELVTTTQRNAARSQAELRDADLSPVVDDWDWRESELPPVPTLFVAVADDAVTPPHGMYEIHDRMPTSELLLIPRGGHFLPLFAPEQFAHVAEDWLSGRSRAPEVVQTTLRVRRRVVEESGSSET
jgi:pimeloyl-ACP methyl ester carboxylesterase/acyl carrier protein